MSNEGIDASLTTLQELCLVAEPTVCGLYWRLKGPDALDTLCSDGVTPTIRKGQALLFDTFINCFYEAYWRDLTTIDRVAFEIVTSGDCVIRLIRRCGDRPETVHLRSASGLQCRTLICAPSDGASGGVLHVDVTAASEETIVHRGRWVTADRLKTNDVSLAIAICSFGHDGMVVETLRRLAEAVTTSDAIQHIFVIHQGQSDIARHPTIVAMVTAGVFGNKLRIIRQDNFGGSGGFARGIIEGLDAKATNILLMDDDVRVEASTFARLTALLAHLKEPMTIGGQMLDLLRPTVLWASHEQVDVRRLALVNPFKGVDLSTVDVTSLFRRRHVSAYNGWWFCALPTAVLEQVGLPLPLFIRHDDVEHGVRMTEAGRRVVTMPGLFVWHEAHESKSKPWLTYYEHRNFLINAALHGRVGAARAGALMATQAWAGLIRHRYEYCWAACRAVEDYLRGPAAVFSDTRARHSEIVAETAKYTLQAVRFYRERAGAMLTGPNQSADTKRVMDLLQLLARPGPRSSLIRRLMIRIARMVVHLLLFGPRVASSYRASANRYSDMSFWRNYLELPSTYDTRNERPR